MAFPPKVSLSGLVVLPHLSSSQLLRGSACSETREISQILLKQCWAQAGR